MSSFQWLYKNWALVAILTAIVLIPIRLLAVEKKADKIEQQLIQVGEYIKNQEQIKELIKKAPPCWEWSEKEEGYVRIPNCKKKK